MKKNTKFVWFSVLVGTAAVVVASLPGGGMLVKAAGTAHTCASIHFGMNDSTKVAKTYGSGNSTAFSSTEETALTEMKANYSSIGGVEITAVSATKVFKNVTNYKLPLKWNSGSEIGTLTLTLNKNIIGATVYAAGYTGVKNGTVTNDSSKIKVNNIEKEITNYCGTTDMNTVTAASAIDVTYVPYVFTFDKTNTLTIVGSTKDKGRFYVADIALRVTD